MTSAHDHPNGMDTLHGLFERQAAATPEAAAVVQEGTVLTYAELDEAARRLAARLRAHGARRGAGVGILLDRSPELVVALLAVLKSGAAYIGLETAHPPRRLGVMLDDAGAALVVTRTDLAGRLPADACPAVLVDDHTGHPPAGTPHPTPVRPADLAYIMYTSGSTGRPKGVMVEHRCVTAFLAGIGSRVRLGPRTRTLQFAGITFDATIGEIFGPLANGGTVVLPPPDADLIGPGLARLLEQQRITTAFLPPSVLAVLPDTELPDLRTLVVGGEAVPTDVAERWGRGRDLHVAYGPTETTLIATTSDRRLPDRPPPIGHPLPGVQAHVLDTDLWPVAPGTVGELYLGGPTVSRGYLGQPALTADLFVPHPFAEQPGARLYRTGDLARVLPDGQLEFAGRTDDQVKIRGVRIEPAEVERVISALPGVRQCAVTARGDGADARLVAFVCGTGLSAARLRREAATALPPTMVPSLFVPLAALPMQTHGGKVDRAVLRTLELSPRPDSTPYEEPADDLERTLAAIWEDVLGVRPVGRADGFTRLGGSSLQAARVLTRIAADLGARPTLRAFHAAESLADVARLVRAGDPAPTSLPEITPTDTPPVPAPGQRRLWFLSHLNPAAAPAYNVPSALRLHGPLDTAALDRALAALADRHDALRSAFTLTDGDLTVSRATPDHTALHLVDATGRPPEEVLAQAAAESARPFDLTRGTPLVRATLYACAPDDHLLVTVMHHLVTDGWSQNVLDRDLALLYARETGTGPDLPAPALRYADFAHWHHTLTRSGALESGLAYWSETLSGAPTRIDLPADRPRPPVQTHTGGRVTTTLPADRAAAVAALAAAENATPFAVHLAAFGALLRFAGAGDDMVIATPTAGRPALETEDLAGFFTNTVPLRLRPDARRTFRSFLREARDLTMDAHEHQYVPLDAVVARIAPDRDLSRQPIAQVALAYQGPLRPQAALPGLDAEPVALDNGTAKFDLTLEIDELPQGIRVTAEYSADLFERDTAQRLLDWYTRLLDAALADPGAPLGTLRPATDAEHAVILPAGPPGPDACLHELFSAQAARTPDRVAVSDDRTRLTYRELDLASNRLAHRLRARGARPETLVGICLDRGTDTAVAILAVLKSGAGYLPLDPGYPPDRLALTVEDSGCRTVVGHRRHTDLIPGADFVDVTDAHDTTAPDTPPDGGAGPHNTAYVIYTSGSTGRPKGVMVTHANVSRLFTATAADLAFGPHDTWSVFHSFAFDFSVWELWGALLHGGRAVVVPYALSRDPEAFWDLLRNEHVTVLSQTPSAFRQLAAAAADRGHPPTDLRLVVFGGEALEPAALRDWLAHYGEHTPRLVNMYGITETTVHVTSRPLTAADAEAAASPIGRPLADLGLALLDADLQPVPVGVQGELYVSGAGVSRGYLGRPALTAQRFLPDPFTGTGARMYRTGDLAVLRPDGELVFCGRADQQVQLRGFRIEPGEIEATLLAEPEVRSAAVVVRADRDGTQRLVGYVVPAPGTRPDAAALRRRLAGRLPAHMVPAALVVLDRLPLTVNGKLDRDALPAPDTGRQAPVRTDASATATLSAIWADVLGVEQVGEDADFFVLGGDSMHAVQVVAASRAAGLPMTVADLFTHPTIAALVGTVLGAGDPARPETGAAGADEEPSGRPADPSAGHPAGGPEDGLTDTYPAATLQTGIIYEYEIRDDPTLYHDLSTVRLAGPLDPAALGDALDDVSARHDLLRASFDLLHDDGPLLRVHQEAPVPLTVVQAPVGPAGDHAAAVREWWTPNWHAWFDLSRPPLARCHALDHGDGSWTLALSVHHAVMDGWSLAVFLTEVVRAYDLRSSGTDAGTAQPSPTGGYRDFVALEQRTATDPGAAEFFKTMLKGHRPAPAAPAAPVGEEPSVRTPPAGPDVDVRRALDPAMLQRARAAAARLAVPVKSVFLAAHLRALAELTGSGDVVTGLTVNGRAEKDGADRMIGMFVNSVPLRVDTTHAAGFGEVVAAAWAAERGITPYRRFPLAALRGALGSAPFDVLFNYADFHAYDPLAGLRHVRPLEFWYSDRNDFPMTVTVARRPLSERQELMVRVRPDLARDGLAGRMADLMLAAVADGVADLEGRTLR
ncbi:amino acid adenylation domain-containing protein [Streptomyces sp. NPDC005573]|uniref:amino acid adenylation domain-containing protein n=1 Tax=Streptomyces sp. NPDC005573 TaxID=3156890 RepID=UPI0033B3068E